MIRDCAILMICLRTIYGCECTCFWFWTSFRRLRRSHLVDKKTGALSRTTNMSSISPLLNAYVRQQTPATTASLECWVLLGCPTRLRSILTCFIRSSHVLGLMATPRLRPNISDALVICQWPSISYSRYSYDILVSNFTYISSCVIRHK